MNWPAVSALLFVAVPAAGQEIAVHSVADISADEPAMIHVEPHLAVDPADPDRLLVGTIVFRERMSVDVLLSEDDGATWLRTPLPLCFADPWVVFAPGGRAYLSCVGHAEVGQSQLVYRSGDGGRTWIGPAEVPRGLVSYDRTAMVLDTAREPARLYLAGMVGSADEATTAFITWSDDGGENFVDARVLPPSNVHVNVSNLLLLDDGRVGLLLNEFAVGDDYRPLRQRRKWWVRWDPRTATFSRPRLAAEDASRLIPVIGHVRLGDGIQRLLVPFVEHRDDAHGIHLASSDDGGDSWAPTVAIVPADSSAVALENAIIASNDAGMVALAWYERPAGAQEGCWRIRTTISVDDGASWPPAATVSTGLSCTHDLDAAMRRRWPVGGDYFGLAAQGSESFRVVWAEAVGAAYRLRTAVVRTR